MIGPLYKRSKVQQIPSEETLHNALPCDQYQTTLNKQNETNSQRVAMRMLQNSSQRLKVAFGWLSSD